MFANTPEPPYTAVIFTSLRSADDAEAYQQMAARMEELAGQQPGFLGVESVRGSDGLGITVSYWQDSGAAAAWKQHSEHLVAQQLGRTQWYQGYMLRICRVEAERRRGTTTGSS